MEVKKYVHFNDVIKNNGRNGNRHYVILKGKVFDVTGFKHPGGPSVFNDNSEDLYGDFVNVHHSNQAVKQLNKLYVGELAFN